MHLQGFTVKKICGLLDISKSVIYWALLYAHMYSISYNPHNHEPGRKCILLQGDLKFIIVTKL